MAIPSLKIGDTTLQPTQYLPSNSFTAVAKKKLSFQRSQFGKLFSQKLYERYTIKVSGIAQDLFEELRHEYEKDAFIDLHSIANRKEVFSASGTTNQFLTSRRIRLESELTPIVHHPAGITITTVTFSNPGGTQGLLTFTSGNPAAGTDNVDITYFPILSGQIVDMDSSWDWVQGEESWSLLFEEG